MSVLNIRKFDPTTLKKGSVILCTGKRCSGKSTMLKCVARHLCDSVDAALAMSDDVLEQEHFRTFMSAPDVHPWDEDRLAAVVAEQRRRMEAGQPQQHVAVLVSSVRFEALVSEVMRYIIMNSRRLNITLALTCQASVDIEPVSRANIDYVFAFQELNPGRRKSLYQNFFGMFSDFPSFDKSFEACTGCYDCLVLDSTLPVCTGPSDCVFWFGTQREHANKDTFHLGARAPAVQDVQALLKQLSGLCEQLGRVATQGQVDKAVATPARCGDPIEGLAREEVSVWLSVAAENGYMDVLQGLARQYSLTWKEMRASGAPILAAEKGHLGVLQYLVDEFGVWVIDSLPDLLAVAAAHGHLAVVQWLVERMGMTPAGIRAAMASHDGIVRDAPILGYFRELGVTLPPTRVEVLERMQAAFGYDRQ